MKKKIIYLYLVFIMHCTTHGSLSDSNIEQCSLSRETFFSSNLSTQKNNNQSRKQKKRPQRKNRNKKDNEKKNKEHQEEIDLIRESIINEFTTWINNTNREKLHTFYQKISLVMISSFWYYKQNLKIPTIEYVTRKIPLSSYEKKYITKLLDDFLGEYNKKITTIALINVKQKLETWIIKKNHESSSDTEEYNPSSDNEDQNSSLSSTESYNSTSENSHEKNNQKDCIACQMYHNIKLVFDLNKEDVPQQKIYLLATLKECTDTFLETFKEFVLLSKKTYEQLFYEILFYQEKK